MKDILDQWYTFWHDQPISNTYKQGYLQAKYEQALWDDDFDTMQIINKLKDQLTRENLGL